jgi:hypothetical protein
MSLYPTADPRVHGAALPDTVIDWEDDQGALIPFATGYTFQARIARSPGGAPVITKTLGITGADTPPNITISWTPAEANQLTAGPWLADVIATRTSDNKPRILRLVIPVRDAV